MACIKVSYGFIQILRTRCYLFVEFVSLISFIYALATAKMGTGGEYCIRYKQTLKGTGIKSKPTQ
jgi:hypothetical protein